MRDPSLANVLISTVVVVGVFLAFLFLVVNPMLHQIEPCWWCKSPDIVEDNHDNPDFRQRCLEQCNITIPEPTPTPECCPCSPAPTHNAVPTHPAMPTYTLHLYVAMTWLNESNCFNIAYEDGTFSGYCFENTTPIAWWNYTVVIK